MPRTPATAASERRVSELVERLFDGLEENEGTVAELARRAGLPHETVRRLYRKPDRRNRSGPGFFIVEAIARARGIRLDDLTAEQTAELGTIDE